MSIGPSTSVNPYLVSPEPNIRFVSVLTTGDPVLGTTVFGGIPDGIGAFDNGNGTMTVLVNHEYRETAGLVRDHGAIGSYITRLVIDKSTLAVVSGDDAIQNLKLWNDTTDSYYAGNGTADADFSRFCSGDLADISAYYNPATGLGTQVRIYATGEESGVEGRAVATIVSGANLGTAYELPFLGNMAYENLTANPLAQDKTIVAMTDDGTGGQVYLYIGTKTAVGTDIDKAGLTNGQVFGIKVTGPADETNAAAINGTFVLQEIGDNGNVSNMTGAQIDADSEAQGVTSFLRPEDSAWDPNHPNVLYFTTTNNFTGNSRLYQLTFTDITHPELGGTIVALLDGSEGQHMFDNLTVADGKVILQEDPGNQTHIARVWEYDIATDTLHQIAQFDPDRVISGMPGFITQDEESSGVLDVTAMLGDADTRAYLLDAQLHTPTGNPATVEPGQLLVMYVDTPVLIGGNGVDDLFGSAAAETLRGFNGNDSLRAGSGIDQLYGGNGNDRLDAGAGNDRLYGDNGDDRLIGGLGNDWLAGGRGNDVFSFDNLTGHTGNDHITDFGGGDRIFLTQQLADLDANNLIDLTDGMIDLSALDHIEVDGPNGQPVNTLAYLGTVVEGDTTYYSYGAAGGGGGGGGGGHFAAAGLHGIADMHFDAATAHAA